MLHREKERAIRENREITRIDTLFPARKRHRAHRLKAGAAAGGSGDKHKQQQEGAVDVNVQIEYSATRR